MPKSKNRHKPSKANPQGRPRKAAPQESQAQDLARSWLDEDEDFFDKVEHYLATHNGEVMNKAVDIIGRRNAIAGNEMIDDILFSAQNSIDSEDMNKTLVCLGARMEVLDSVSAADLVKSYLDAEGVGRQGASYSFHMQWLPMTMLSTLNAFDLWAMRQALSHESPKVDIEGSREDKRGWYMLMGMRRATILTSKDEEASEISVDARLESEGAWREKVMEATPGLLNVIVPELVSHVKNMWEDFCDGEEFDDDADEKNQNVELIAVSELQALVDVTQYEAGEKVASIQIIAAQSNVLRFDLIGESGRLLDGVSYPLLMSAITPEFLESMSEVLSIPVSMAKPSAAVSAIPDTTLLLKKPSTLKFMN